MSKRENYQIRSEHDPEAWESHYEVVRNFIADQWEQGIGNGVSIEGWGNATSPFWGHNRTEVGFRNNPRYVNLREFVGLDRGEIDSISAVVEVPTSTGMAIYDGSHRRQGEFRDPFYPSSTTVARYDEAGKLVYYHEFKNPRVPELMSRLIMKKIVRVRNGEEKVEYDIPTVW